MLSNIYEGELRKNYPHRYVDGLANSVETAADRFVMDNYQILESAIDNGPYFFGENCTILDIYIWMFVNWLEDIDEFRRLCPKIVRLAEAVMNRPRVTQIHLDNFGDGLGWPV